MTALLEVKDLEILFKKDQDYISTVKGVSFLVNTGETLGVVGESGCGKSVTSLSIMGLLPSDYSKLGADSKIEYNGKSLIKMSDGEYRQIRGKEISMIFQDPMSSLNPVLTIGYQMNEMILAHSKVSKAEARKKSVSMLKKVGIPRAEEIINEYPHQLSGGMRQRVMIAIALSCNPKLLIADEPTTALDVTIQAQILDLMKSLQQEFNTAIMLITHDLGVVAENCDRVIVMYAGKVVEEGPVEHIFNHTKHPYTVGLLHSIPSLADEQQRLMDIPGSVPLADQMPKGCRFAPRCQFATAKCNEQEPPREKISEEHFTSCWLYSEEGVN
ncbi:peptide/nickel transport system ATP-binding protein [Bacillus mesophilus]|uniref:ABC transporter ATP-binding protein n=1 Tax=Bacillus mesophilus TaxID=1808955 RepID=A0A6M0Q7L0_9BACI|nr:ABC transporter ATP-binding protein [Bacillus mesophilus]MBM7661674.1 peptide/nickel transport system ATP-binding protein [Bacillus mesophilus]NEY72336.1 ABC transporter ATP-binding protein [Bacillus mesophilus]